MYNNEAIIATQWMDKLVVGKNTVQARRAETLFEVMSTMHSSE